MSAKIAFWIIFGVSFGFSLGWFTYWMVKLYKASKASRKKQAEGQ